MLDAELPAKSIMTALKLSRSTFFEWKRLYRERGVKGLEVRPIPGGAPKLTDQQTNQLLRWIVGRDPRQFQFDFALWTRKSPYLNYSPSCSSPSVDFFMV